MVKPIKSMFCQGAGMAEGLAIILLIVIGHVTFDLGGERLKTELVVDDWSRD
jgi:hypothetical protein